MYEVHTRYGVETLKTLAEAKDFARYVAQTTGRTASIKKVAETPGPDMTDHDDPCVCGTYDRCKAQREADYRRSGDWRDLHRAYND